MKYLALYLLLISAPTLGQTSLYKCTQDDGSVGYQDSPCAESDKQSSVDVVVHNNSGIEDPELRLISMRQIAVGMSEKGLLRSWGKPTKINRSSYGPAQWVYDRGPGHTQFVYVEDGVITAWSD